ncbi:hypothetical protein EYF80_015695 [Liparis tanakae]|uniref:Uncharacterized protein n=1 Tax=Liparis tanakae TaxID=230148 RepID=A0A4Z2I9L1_9TELE|nr:hypothetical protein EYF80_015695 [Liparis tanakae]
MTDRFIYRVTSFQQEEGSPPSVLAVTTPLHSKDERRGCVSRFFSGYVYTAYIKTKRPGLERKQSIH